MTSRKKVYLYGDFNTPFWWYDLRLITENAFKWDGVDFHISSGVMLSSASKARDLLACKSSDHLLFLSTIFTNDPYMIHLVTKNAIQQREKTLFALLVWDEASMEIYQPILSVYQEIKNMGVKCFKGGVDKVFGDISNFIINGKSF